MVEREAHADVADGPPVSVAMFRIGFGVLYLDMALQKAPWIIGPEGEPFGWLYGFVQKQIEHPTFEFYRDFLQTVVLLNFAFFGSRPDGSRPRVRAGPVHRAGRTRGGRSGSSISPWAATRCPGKGTGSGSS
jgi:hypothetical protein